MHLTEHFKKEEFEKRDPIPASAVPSFVALCAEILEPVRVHFGKPLHITSGYRSPEHNASINGSKTSQHVATEEYCAADFQVPGLSLVDVFDWLRLSSGLRFDQCILEYGKANDADTDDCIHVSWKREPRRIAMVGATNNRAPYVRVEVA